MQLTLLVAENKKKGADFTNCTNLKDMCNLLYLLCKTQRNVKLLPQLYVFILLVSMMGPIYDLLGFVLEVGQ